MSEAGNLFTLLRQSADPGAASAIEELVQDAPDHALSRVNVVDFATKAAGLPIADEHAALKRWYETVSARPGMAA